jgi:hypothetical protein
MNMDPDLKETVEFIRVLQRHGSDLICATIGSPYYNVHMQRPAYYPVSDGYLMPENPLYNVSRHIAASRRIKELCPEIKIVGSGLTAFRNTCRMPPNIQLRTGRWISPESGEWCCLILIFAVMFWKADH